MRPWAGGAEGEEGRRERRGGCPRRCQPLPPAARRRRKKRRKGGGAEGPPGGDVLVPDSPLRGLLAAANGGGEEAAEGALPPLGSAGGRAPRQGDSQRRRAPRVRSARGAWGAGRCWHKTFPSSETLLSSQSRTCRGVGADLNGEQTFPSSCFLELMLAFLAF